MNTQPLSSEIPMISAHTRHGNDRTMWTKRGRFAVTSTLIVLGALGAIYQAIASTVDQRVDPPSGQIVDIGGYRLHLNIMGENADLAWMGVPRLADLPELLPHFAGSQLVAPFPRMGEMRSLCCAAHYAADQSAHPHPYKKIERCAIAL